MQLRWFHFNTFGWNDVAFYLRINFYDHFSRVNFTHSTGKIAALQADRLRASLFFLGQT